MRICIFGAGAIGGLIAGRLALAGEDVTVIGRGAHFTAIKAKGIELHWQDGRIETARVKAIDTAASAGQQDLVVLAVKAHSLERAAADVEALLGSETKVMTIQNGMPWWYFQKHGGPLDGTRLKSLDPRGMLSSTFHPDRIIGCAVFVAAEVSEPGVIRHIGSNRFPIGEIDGRLSDRVRAVEAAFVKAGLQASAVSNIRAEIWWKALGNLAVNPISALTNTTMIDILRFPETRALVLETMWEAREIAAKIGISFNQTLEQRLESAESVGAHKTSMLQDLESGRPLEIEALTGAVLEMARLTDTLAPRIEAVYGLTKLLDRSRRRPAGPGD
ncbi:MAG: ketopantoate reductase family protein [Methyloceanibacter sp.]